MLDTPIGTVKGRMRLGLEKMRGELGGLRGGGVMSRCAARATTPAPTCSARSERTSTRPSSAHLAAARRCRREVAELRVAAEALPLAADAGRRRRPR